MVRQKLKALGNLQSSGSFVCSADSSMMRRLASPCDSRRLFLRTAVLFGCVATICVGCSATDDVGRTIQSSWCPNAFFNFGDSLSDTGNSLLANPDTVPTRSLPYGDLFFQKATGRACNGRLVIDFMLLAFNLPLLNPYLLPSHNNDPQGLNFAYLGATASPTLLFSPFPLPFQVDQFIQIKLKNKVLPTQREQSSSQNTDELDQGIYSTALYTLCIGGNDVIDGLLEGLQPNGIIQEIVPTVLYDIVSAIEALYLQGARKFLVSNGPPLGCATKILTLFNDLGFTVDSLGCFSAINEVNQALNSELFKSVEGLRVSLPNVSIIHFDYYAVNIEILVNPSKYGFNPDLVHTACCGGPGLGTMNFDSAAKCGKENFTECDSPNEYITWDGVHWTEAFYRQVAKFVLNGEFSDPPTNLTKACDLSFENFGPTTYEELFPESDKLFPESDSVAFD